MNDLVSVIIPTYNRSQMLERAINSVLQQTYENIEVIIVDDNNPTSTARKETEVLLQPYLQDRRIRYIKHERNLGGCAARNTGIKSSKGNYLAFLDDDDYWESQFITTLLKRYDHPKYDNLGAVYSNFKLQKYNKIISNHPPVNIKIEGDIRNTLLSEWCPTSTSLFIIKKECFINVGYFDENLPSFQDYDMWLNISKQYQFDYCDELLVVKTEHGGDQISINPYKRKAGLNKLKEKWLSILEPEEAMKFKKFIKEQELLINRNKIIDRRMKKNLKRDFLSDLTKYFLNKKVKFHSKISLLFIVIFGRKGKIIVENTKMKFIQSK